MGLIMHHLYLITLQDNLGWLVDGLFKRLQSITAAELRTILTRMSTYGHFVQFPNQVLLAVAVQADSLLRLGAGGRVVRLRVLLLQHSKLHHTVWSNVLLVRHETHVFLNRQEKFIGGYFLSII